MHRLLLAAAASAAILTPAISAQAQPFTGSSFTTDSGSQVQQGRHGPGRGDGNRHHRRHDRTDAVIGWGWDVDWAYYNNRAFQPDSYNGWWHDRPDRAYPHWMQTNQNCDRMWYSADILRC
jgi:hypothetical protein